MKSPLVSVCIPAYRADKYIEAALTAVAAQEFTDWEVIVTEDGSKDRTEEIVKRFAASTRQPVIYNRHEVNRGLPSTRNTGIAAARGDWVAFLDADDLWTPGHLAALVEKSQTGDFDLIFSGTIPFDDATGQQLTPCVPASQDMNELPVALFTGRLSVLPSSVLVRRTAFERYGYISTDFPHVNDTEYWLRVLKQGGQVGYSGEATCLYRKHEGSMSRRAAEILSDSARLCERYANWTAIPNFLKRARPADLYRWAGRTLLSEDPVAARKALNQSVRLEPLNPKNLVLWTKAFVRQNIIRRQHA
jgi:glycosyltransferase involved in cell wall biosynthesis